jgi:hypothetical protein
VFGASLVFEQTYEAIDGDSASSSELYALMSALSGYPIRQDLAVTGAVDQQGNVQSVGAINEKIEAFFDVCVAARSLGSRGGARAVQSNVRSLMLRSDVAQAVGRRAVPRLRGGDGGGGHRAAHRDPRGHGGRERSLCGADGVRGGDGAARAVPRGGVGGAAVRGRDPV